MYTISNKVVYVHVELFCIQSCMLVPYSSLHFSYFVSYVLSQEGRLDKCTSFQEKSQMRHLKKMYVCKMYVQKVSTLLLSIH